MSGGRLVVLDRLGRDVKQYPLACGLATLGSAPSCDIRVMLPAVSAHHATVVVHANQTVVRNVGEGETLVNGCRVSVAALAHGDVLALGGRALRWEYAGGRAPPRAALAALVPGPAYVARRGRGRGRARGRGAGRAARRGSAGAAGAGAAGRSRALQLAIEMSHRASMPGRTGGKQVAVVQPQRRDPHDPSGGSSPPPPPPPPEDDTTRKSLSMSPGGAGSTTQATLWIESRKSSPRKSARPRAVAKIEAPAAIDRTKRAALMLMAGHSPRGGAGGVAGGAGGVARSVTAAQVADRDAPHPTVRGSNVSRRSGKPSPVQSPAPPSPKKSALKDPRKNRKTESIKFDLSNLGAGGGGDATACPPDDTASEDDVALHYSDTSSPSPRRSIHSRSSRILERSIGTPMRVSAGRAAQPRGSAAASSSSRGSLILQRALDDSRYSRRSGGASPRSGAPGAPPPGSPSVAESYSVVDLVSLDSAESPGCGSVYSSAASAVDTTFGTPRASAGRRTRSSLEPTLLGSSTPFAGTLPRSSRRSPGSTRSRSDPDDARKSTRRARSSGATRRSKSLSTPENTRPISVNSTRISRASRSRSRINGSDLVLIDADERATSPKSSKRASGARGPGGEPAPPPDGAATPERRRSPAGAGTPLLSIQGLLAAGLQPGRPARRGRASLRRTTGGPDESRGGRPEADEARGVVARKTILRLSRESAEASDGAAEGGRHVATPRSAAKPVQEAVKNKHSTAKKPVSKRSIIDDLNESDIVKQLFSSPVKRKLSRSITEFSRKMSFDDEDRDVAAGRPSLAPPAAEVREVGRGGAAPRGRRSARNDLTDVRGVKAVFARSPTNRLSDVAVKNVFAAAPSDDLTRVAGVKALFRSQKKTRSPRNDLTDVRGVKALFGTNPGADDLRDVSGVKRTMRRNSPLNDLRDVRGVSGMFGEEGRRGEGDVSGVEALPGDPDGSFVRLGVGPGTRTPRGAAAVDPRTDKPSVIRELRKLATDTVPGTDPIRMSRVRDSTVMKASHERERSAAQAYSARKLPIKKRSIVEASPQRGPARSTLPIKKRAVVHSTPVKGRAAGGPPAPRLGRVSPIHPPAHTPVHTPARPARPNETPPKPKRPSKSKNEITQDEPETEPSPRTGRAKAGAGSPAPARVTRSRRLDKTDSSDNTKKRRASLVVTKKSPGMSPAPPPPPPPRATRNNTKIAEKKNTPKLKSVGPKKLTRRQKTSEVAAEVTPKRNTRAKAMNPRAGARGGKGSDEADNADTDEPTRKQKRTRYAAGAEAPRTRAAPAPAPATKRRKPGTSRPDPGEEHSPVKRGRKAKLPSVELSDKESADRAPRTRGKSKTAEVKKNETQDEHKVARTRGNTKVTEEKPPEEATKGRTRGKPEGRGGAGAEPAAPRRPRRAAARDERAEASGGAAGCRPTRLVRRAELGEELPAGTPVAARRPRGRKAAPAAAPAPEPVAGTNRRKRKANMDVSSAKAPEAAGGRRPRRR